MNLQEKKEAKLKKRRGFFFQLGLTIILSVLLISFELTRVDSSKNKYAEMVTEGKLTAIKDIESEPGMSIDETELKAKEEKKSPEEIPKDKVFYIVDHMPGFQGKGQDGFRRWISQNVKYPAMPVDSIVTGKVFVRFIVEPDGSVSTVKLVRGLNNTLNQEAIRLIKSSPKWEPGMVKDKAVRVAFTFPVTFAPPE